MYKEQVYFYKNSILLNFDFKQVYFHCDTLLKCFGELSQLLLSFYIFLYVTLVVLYFDSSLAGGIGSFT